MLSVDSCASLQHYSCHHSTMRIRYHNEATNNSHTICPTLHIELKNIIKIATIFSNIKKGAFIALVYMLTDCTFLFFCIYNHNDVAEEYTAKKEKCIRMKENLFQTLI